jgi:hypothetical protein
MNEAYSRVQKRTSDREPNGSQAGLALHVSKFRKLSLCRSDSYRVGKNSLIALATSGKLGRREWCFKYSNCTTYLIVSLILLQHIIERDKLHQKSYLTICNV